MEAQALVTIVGVGGALLGSVLGGVISFLSSRSMRRMEWELSVAEKNILHRELIYAEFLSEAYHLMLQSLDEKISKSVRFATIVSLEAKISLQSPLVGSIAREMISSVIDNHSQEPKDKSKKFPELRDRYLEECKKDILALRNNT